MTSASRTDRRPVDLVPTVALVLAVICTIVPHAAGTAVASAEPARIVPLVSAEVAR